MKPATRVRMMDIGGVWITGTVQGPGPTTEIRPMNPAENEDIETVVVNWDEPHRGSDTVAAEAVERLDG